MAISFKAWRIKVWRINAWAGAAALVMAVAGGVVVVGTTSQEACAAPKPQTSFAEDVLPIFRGRCFSCHSPGTEGAEKSGLDLTTYEGVMKGTKLGAMVLAKDPDGSNLMWLLDHRGKPETRMPHGGKKLSTCDRDAIRSWIREGAKNN
jgi:mono/diheme cytochrome c family protein